MWVSKIVQGGATAATTLYRHRRPRRETVCCVGSGTASIAQRRARQEALRSEGGYDVGADDDSGGEGSPRSASEIFASISFTWAGSSFTRISPRARRASEAVIAILSSSRQMRHIRRWYGSRGGEVESRGAGAAGTRPGDRDRPRDPRALEALDRGAGPCCAPPGARPGEAPTAVGEVWCRGLTCGVLERKMRRWNSEASVRVGSRSAL